MGEEIEKRYNREAENGTEGCCTEEGSSPENKEEVAEAISGEKVSENKEEGSEAVSEEVGSKQEDSPEAPGDDAVRDLLQVKDAQIEELLGRLKRLQADFDNYKKRTQKEKEEMGQRATASFVETLLPVLDNFQRAIQTGGSEEISFREGIEMIIKQLEKALKDAGLEPMDCVGKPFDPNFHNAVFMVEDDTFEENTVVEEVQKGYFFCGKVLRPAMVKVSRKSSGEN